MKEPGLIVGGFEANPEFLGKGVMSHTDGVLYVLPGDAVHDSDLAL